MSVNRQFFSKSTDDIMYENKISNFFQLHQTTCYKQIFSLLNNKDNNFATGLLAKDRSIRNMRQNKFGPLSQNI